MVLRFLQSDEVNVAICDRETVGGGGEGGKIKFKMLICNLSKNTGYLGL